MHKYEIMFIIRPDAAPEDVEKLLKQMESVVESAGGSVGKVERIGARRLAYRIGKHREGLYILFILQGTGETIKEFERRLKVTDTVIKFLTVRVDEEEEKALKLKAARAKKEARRARPKPAAQAAPQAAEAPQA